MIWEIGVCKGVEARKKNPMALLGRAIRVRCARKCIQNRPTPVSYTQGAASRILFEQQHAPPYSPDQFSPEAIIQKLFNIQSSLSHKNYISEN